MIEIKNLNSIEELNLQTIAVWGIQVSKYLHDINSLNEILSDDEKLKVNNLKNTHQKKVSIISRGALRILSSAYMDVHPEGLVFSKTKNGKPFIKNSSLAFNISHSADWIILSFGLNCNIGVDLEILRDDIDYKKIAKRFFSKDEQIALEITDEPIRLFFDLWARKEAIIKANSTRLLTSIKSTIIPMSNYSISERCEVSPWHVYAIEAGSRYAAALAVDKNIEHQPCYDFGGLKWEN